jgi:DNA mismatch endonuclease (patch repair protein)
MRGNPDFVFRAERVIVFVDGCFWHRCPRCFRMPQSNLAYWSSKITSNVVRDRALTRKLRAEGWTVVRIWEHTLSTPDRAIARIRNALRCQARRGHTSAG